MLNLVRQSTPDRPALVNQILGRAFGAPGRGLLRPGQTIPSLSTAEAGQVLETLRLRYPVTRDTQTGWRTIAPVPSLSIAADSRNPVARIWLGDVRNIRSALAPAFDLLRTSVCHPKFCRETIHNHVDIVELGFSDLAAAIADEEPAFLVEPILRGVTGRADAEITRNTGLRLLRSILSEDGLGAEAQAASLTIHHQIELIEALRQALVADPPVEATRAELYAKAAQCVGCIEEAISDIRAIAAEIGLTSCDFEEYKLHISGLDKDCDLEDILKSAAREWRLIDQLAAKGGKQATEAIVLAADQAADLTDGLRKDQTNDLQRKLGLERDGARRLSSRLKRLGIRANNCADYIYQSKIKIGDY